MTRMYIIKCHYDFNPRSSCEERRASAWAIRRSPCDFNPRSSCEERHDSGEEGGARHDFNPRSSCEERLHRPTSSYFAIDFNPRSSCEERQKTPTFQQGFGIFQSTLLMRGATPRRPRPTEKIYLFQSTLLMRGATILAFLLIQWSRFQSTLLMRGATSCPQHLHAISSAISIHAPHARSDATPSTTSTARRYFNPRSSCEERPGCRLATTTSTISIHAPHARSDTALDIGPHTEPIFQSTLLMRGATVRSWMAPARLRFQSTLLMRGATVSLSSIDLLDFIIHFSRTQHLFPKTLLLTLCPVSSISCVMALRA